MANLVAGQIDHLWGVSLSLSRCKFAPVSGVAALR
jgi:hypothetical protein